MLQMYHLQMSHYEDLERDGMVATAWVRGDVAKQSWSILSKLAAMRGRHLAIFWPTASELWVRALAAGSWRLAGDARFHLRANRRGVLFRSAGKS